MPAAPAAPASAATSSQRTPGSPCVSGSARTSNAAVKRPSPASTAVASSNSLWQVGRPRRKSLLSIAGRSSCTREYAWTISVAAAACANASGKEIASDHNVSVKFRRLRGDRAIPTDNDSVDPLLRLVELPLAMAFEQRSPFVGEDRFIEPDLSSFEPADDLL